MSRWSYHLPILGYHRVGEFRGDHVPTVSAHAFEWQLIFLARLRYRVLDLDEVIECVERGGEMPRRCVAITFDDGYEETYKLAWPILKRLGFSASVFVTPIEVGLPGFSTWEQITEMARNGITIGSHTMNHAYLPLVKEDQLKEEIVGSKEVIERQLGEPIHYISYPVGGFTPLAQVIARRAGYKGACTTNRAWSRRDVDPFALRRVKVTERDRNPLLFWAKVSGYYDAFRRLEQPA